MAVCFDVCDVGLLDFWFAQVLCRWMAMMDSDRSRHEQYELINRSVSLHSFVVLCIVVILQSIWVQTAVELKSLEHLVADLVEPLNDNEFLACARFEM